MFKTYRPLFAGLALALAPAGTAALAADVSASKPETLVSAMQDAGYRATLTTDQVGDPKIESAAAGVNFGVLFYGCTDGADCTDVCLSAGFDLENGSDLQTMNDWNSSELVGQAFLDSEMDPFIDQCLISLDGMPEDRFIRILERWDTAVADFQRVIGF